MTTQGPAGLVPNTAALAAATAQARVELQALSSFASMEVSDAELRQFILGTLNAGYAAQFPPTKQGS